MKLRMREDSSLITDEERSPRRVGENRLQVISRWISLKLEKLFYSCKTKRKEARMCRGAAMWQGGVKAEK